MSEGHLVTRTAGGLSDFNTLTARRLWTVVIYIHAPGEQADGQDCGDSYQLLSDRGLYDETLQRSDAVREDEQHLALRFTEVVPEGTYSLYHRLSCGVEFPVFMAVPFEFLEDHGEQTPEPSHETRGLPTLQAEPELVSGDPLLLHDPADHAIPDLEEEQPDASQPDEAIA